MVKAWQSCWCEFFESVSSGVGPAEAGGVYRGSFIRFRFVVVECSKPDRIGWLQFDAEKPDSGRLETAGTCDGIADHSAGDPRSRDRE